MREAKLTERVPGAVCLPSAGCEFVAWAPLAKKLEVHLVAPVERIVGMHAEECGYSRAVIGGIGPGSRYFLRLEGKTDRPDPASRFQPEGVHGPSQITDPEFGWTDDQWKGVDLCDYIFYELHVGAFTADGTFGSAIQRLDDLKHLGITAIELMPVAQFPGNRNWGYDGVFPYAPQNSYGGPAGLKSLVDACHARGMAVVLDVVYNHLGPEGNYFASFGPYFTDRYHTPWGAAINFDGPESDHVRNFFIQNALYWTREFHIDALRLDAVHAIVDESAFPFLEELGDAVHAEAKELGRKVHVIAESDRNDPRIVRPQASGGYGLDAVWSDDFHHALHAILTGERNGYYCGFGTIADLGKAYREGFVYSGQFSKYRKHRHGNSSRDVPACRFVIFAQNHDQVGNRAKGERAAELMGFDDLKIAAGLVLLSPYLPLLFMGEEYGERTPFQYFVSHSDPALIEAVRKGRQQEFAAFEWSDGAPNPQAESTFTASKLEWDRRHEGKHRALYVFTRELIRLRKRLSALSESDRDHTEVITYEKEALLWVDRTSNRNRVIAIFNLSDSETAISLPFPVLRLQKSLDSCDQQWGGSGGTAPEVLEPEDSTPLRIAGKSLLLYTCEQRKDRS